jgi:hypothetical protein
MNDVNENSHLVRLSDLMDSSEGWGRVQGRDVYGKLVDLVESHPGVAVFRVSLAGVRKADISFASETLVEIARRYRGSKGFCFVDLTDQDMLENWQAAAERKRQPIMVWDGASSQVIGAQPSQGNLPAFLFAMARPRARATEFAAATPNMSIANASTKFKQLWEQGFLLRREGTAESRPPDIA